MLEDARRKGFALAWFHADFLAGANLENGNSHVLLQSILRFFKFLPGRRKKERRTFLDYVIDEAS